MKTVPFFTPTASLMAVALGSFPLMAEESHRHTAPDAVSQDDTVMVVTAPVVSPLEVVTSPKTPRQPVPASDGSDYLKTIKVSRKSETAAPTAIPFFAACLARG